MKVICTDGDFSKVQLEVVKAILLVGDDFLLPKQGVEYEVIGHATFLDGRKAYELKELEDPRKYGYDKKLFFFVERFIVSDKTFVPNAYCKELDAPCRQVNYYMQGVYKIANLSEGMWVHK